MAERLVAVLLSTHDALFAVEAARRFSTDGSDRMAVINEDSVVLSGRSGAEVLRRVWRATLLNERLVHEADTARRRLLADLLS